MTRKGPSSGHSDSSELRALCSLALLSCRLFEALQHFPSLHLVLLGFLSLATAGNLKVPTCCEKTGSSGGDSCCRLKSKNPAGNAGGRFPHLATSLGTSAPERFASDDTATTPTCKPHRRREVSESPVLFSLLGLWLLRLGLRSWSCRWSCLRSLGGSDATFSQPFFSHRM